MNEPGRRLSPNARWVWRLQQGAFWVVVLVVVLALDVSAALTAVPVLGLLAGAGVWPAVRWRHWRWDVSSEAIVMRRGTLVVRETVVPMLRVQHVDTTSDILEQALDLSNVVVHTAAGSHKIPLLGAAAAGELRSQIARLAQTDGT
jgi:uncharacterized protein